MAGNIYAELIAFSETLKPWQQDALRRHTSSAVLSSTDVAVLTDIAYEANLKGERALVEREGEETTFDNPAVVPLSQTHVPNSSAVAPPVTLAKVQHLQGVNRLRAGTDLTLKPTGLNIIFGLNGVGKSGYTRILKSCCHAKAKEAIKGDIFEAAKPEPRAKIWYQIGETELEHEWNPQTESDNNDLSRVAVYDSHTASVHVGKNPTELSFTPAGLDLIKYLTGTYEAVALEAKARIAVLNAQQIPSIFADAVSPAVRKTLDSLGKIGALELLNLIGDLTAEEQNELAELPGEIANLRSTSKSVRESQARLESTNYRNQGNRIRTLSEKVNHDQVSVLRSVWFRLRQIDAEQVLEIKHDFTAEPVPGVLSPHWKSMWIAAQDYAKNEQEFDSDFPSKESEYCPLCHQALSEEAHERLSRFRDVMAKDLDAEKQRLKKQMTAIVEGIRIALSDENINADMLTLLETQHPNEITNFRQSVALVNKLIGASSEGLLESDALIEELTSPFINEIDVNEQAPMVSPVAEQLLQTVALFEKITKNFDDIVKSIQDESDDGSEISDKVARHLELDERSKVASALAKLHDHHNRFAYISALEKVATETATRSLSDKSRTLTSAYVTRISEEFTANLRMIENLSDNAPENEARLRVKLVPSVKKSVNNIAFTMDGASDASEKANGVLSEGELRAVSVAAFLADVSTSDDGSAIIFDDPMNSLDHDFQTRIAIRLADEAHSRQVIIFTHSMSFVGALWHEGVQKSYRRQVQAKVPNPTKVGATYIEITRHPELGAGMQVAGTGTPTQGFKNLLTKLDQEIIPAARKHHSGDDFDLKAYADDCVKFATNLRNAWEFAVEEIMIGGVVARNQPAVRTGMLSTLVVITPEDVAAVDDGMDLNSYYVHSTGDGNQISLPSPTNMADRVQSARDWLKDFNKRKAAQES